MSAQNFLGDFANRVKRVVAGDDYLDLDKADKRTTKQRTGEWIQDRNRRAEAHRVGQKTPAGTTMGGTGYTPFQKTPKVPSASTVNSSPISSPISPKPTATTPPKPTGGATTPGMTVKGGLGTALVGAAANYAVPWIVEESTRGARMLLGDKNYNTPVNIKSVNGTNYDISTSGGMEAYKKAKASAGTSTPAYSGSRKGAMIGVPNDDSYRTEEIAAGQKAENFRKGAGFPGQTPTVPTRDVAKADGSKGTQTSPGGGMPVLDAATAAAFLQSKGIGLGAFSSIQLPGTQSNPNSGIVPDAVPFGGQEQSVTGNTLGAFTRPNGLSMPNLGVTGMEGITIEQAFTDPKIGQALSSTFSQYGGLATGNGAFTRPTQGSKSYTEISPTDPLYAEAFGEDLAKKNGGGGSSRLNAALADTAGMQSYMSKFGSPEQDMRRAADMAFLNTSGSQEGLRAKEAVLGQFTAGGQTYQLGPDKKFLQGDNGKPAAMDRKAASGYRQGTIDAEAYKNSYKDQVKAIPAATITTPKQAENPTAQSPVPATKASAYTVDPNVIENYDFTKPGAEKAYFGPGGILEQQTGRR